MKIEKSYSNEHRLSLLSGAFGGLGMGLLLLVFSFQLVSAQTAPTPTATSSISTEKVATTRTPAGKDDNRYRIGPGDVLDIRF
jgi:hypothetical protein